MLSGEIVRVGSAEGGITAQVDIVEIDGERYALKTHSEFEIKGEERFQRELAELGLPHLTVYEHQDLTPEQMLMGFIDAKKLNGPNFNPENMALLGKTLSRLHGKTFDHFHALNGHGELRIGSWEEFIDRMKRHAQRTGWFGDPDNTAIEKSAARLIESTPQNFVLCHGDLHGNNVFCTDRGLVLFDNNADAFVATPEYDLATLFGEVLPGYRYGEDNAQGSADRENMEAFLEGYGPLPEGFEEHIDSYVFLRLLERYPNKFVRHQDKILELIADKLLRSSSDSTLHGKAH